MKSQFTILAFPILLVGLFDTASSQTFQWAKQMMGSVGSSGKGVSVTVDALDNVYTVGGFEGTVDFDPGPGAYPLTSVGECIFISKVDPRESPLGQINRWCVWWATSLLIAVDALGNSYYTGGFRGTVDFDPSISTNLNLTATGGGHDIFISKLDPSGNFLWARQMVGGFGTADYGHAIAIDALGFVYTTGIFGGTVDFNPSPGGGAIFNLSTTWYDAFMSKRDGSGNFVWAKKIGGASTDFGESIAVDALGYVYTTGYFDGTVDFDPGLGVYPLTGSGSFVTKLDVGGNFIWAKIVNTNSVSLSIALDALSNIYTLGTFTGIVNFNPNGGPNNMNSTSGNVYLLKLDNGGNYVWSKQLFGEFDDLADRLIAIDGSGSIFVTGSCNPGTWDFDPGVGVTNLTSVGLRDIFITKLENSGAFSWALLFGGGGFDEGTSIALDACVNAYTTGYFTGTADFDPGVLTFSLTSLNDDIFIHNLSDNCVPLEMAN